MTITTLTKFVSVLLIFLFSLLTLTSTTAGASSSSSSSVSSTAAYPVSVSVPSSSAAAAAAVASIEKMFHRDGNNSNNNNSRRQQQHQGQRQAQQDDYVNFTELLDPENDSTVSNLIQQLNTYLNSTNADGNLAVNDLIHQFLPSSSSTTMNGEEGSSIISFDIGNGGFVLDLGSASVITLQRVTIVGLDTIEALNLLQPVTALDGYESPETVIQNSFVLKKLILDLDLTEMMTADDGVATTNNVLIRLPFDDVNFNSVPIRLALFQEAIAKMPMGAILQYQDFLLPCLQQIIEQLELVELEIDFGTIQEPILMNNEDDTVSSPFYEIVSTLFVMLPQAVPVFFNSTIRDLLNEMFVGLIDGDGSSCPSYDTDTDTDTDTDNDELIDFRTFFTEGLPAMAMTLIDDQLIAINPETGLPKMNNVVIEPLLKSMNQKKKGDQSSLSSSSSSSSLTFGGDTDNNDENNNLFDFSTYIGIGGLQADIKMSLQSIQLLNLTTMTTPMEMLQTLPQEPYKLNNTMTMGLPLADRPMSVRLNNLYFAVLTDDDGSIENEMNIQMDIEALNVILTALLQIVKSKLYSFPMEDILNMNCWLATIATPTLDTTYGTRLPEEDITAALTTLLASMKAMQLTIGCVGKAIDGAGCSSPGMMDLINTLDTSPEAQMSVTNTMNQLLDYGASLLVPSADNNNNGGALLQVQIDRWLNEAALQCPHSADYDPNAVIPVPYLPLNSGTNASDDYQYSVDYLILWGSVLLALLLLLCVVIIFVQCYARCRNQSWLNQKISHQDKDLLESVQEQEDSRDRSINATTHSMFGSSTSIPCYIRYGMPMIILGNIALFLSGHLNLGATVNIEVLFAGDVIRVDNFYNFSIARSTIDMWKAGSEELAILILIFSGIWPYTKQLITLVVWFLPPSFLSVSKRGSILLWVDWLAKWSMIDVFVIVVCLAAFRVTITSPDQVAFLPPDFYVIDLLVVPMWGLYSNMTAQLVSQVSSHYIIYYHRQIVNNAAVVSSVSSSSSSEEEDQNNEQQLERKQNSSTSSTSTCGIDSSSPPREGEGDRTKYLLWKQDFRRPHSAVNRSVVVRTWVHPAMILLSILLAMVVIAGCILPTFSIEILGVIGVAVESGQQFEEAKTYHSVISIVAMLFEEAKFLDTPGDYIGLTVLSCLFLCTVLFIPIVQAMCLLVQWFLPLTRTQRTRMWVLNEILQAWQYMEVYLLALFVASWQLGPVSQYLFNSYCKDLRGFFAQLVSYEILKEEDAQCFGVQGAIEPGSFTLVAAAMVLALLNSFVTKATRQYNYYLERSLPDVDVEDVHVHEDVHADNDAENNSNNHHHDSSTTTVAPFTTTTTTSTKLRPIPVMFTDTYRWLLRGGGEGVAAAAGAITMTTVEEVDKTNSMEAGRASLSTTADGKEGSFRNSRRLSPPSRTRNSRSSLQGEDVGVP